MSNQTDPAVSVRRRRHKRYGRKGRVTIRRVRTGPSLRGDLFDLSIGGCLLWMETAARFEATDLIEVKLRTGPLAIRVMGSIRYAGDEGRILGLEFQHVGSAETLALVGFIAELHAGATNQMLFPAD